MNQIREVFNDEVLNKITNKYKLNTNLLNKIGGFENMIYEYSIGNAEYIIRITHNSHRSKNLLIGEIEWLNYLSDNGASVAKPVKLFSNNYLEDIQNNGSQFYITCFQKINGYSARDVAWSNEYIQNLGKIIGEIHHLSRTYTPSYDKIKRPDWNDNVFMSMYKKNPELQGIYDKFYSLIEEVSSIPKTDSTYGLTHGDIHFGNFKVEDNKAILFDFDSCSYCWYMNDIAVLLFYSICIYGYQEEKSTFVNNFLKYFLHGYEQFNHLDSGMIKHLPKFLKLREYDLFLTLYSLPVNEYYEYEKHFMNNRKQSIEIGLPFVNI